MGSSGLVPGVGKCVGGAIRRYACDSLGNVQH